MQAGECGDGQEEEEGQIYAKAALPWVTDRQGGGRRERWMERRTV